MNERITVIPNGDITTIQIESQEPSKSEFINHTINVSINKPREKNLYERMQDMKKTISLGPQPRRTSY